MWISIQEDNK